MPDLSEGLSVCGGKWVVESTENWRSGTLWCGYIHESACKGTRKRTPNQGRHQSGMGFKEQGIDSLHPALLAR